MNLVKDRVSFKVQNSITIRSSLIRNFFFFFYNFYGLKSKYKLQTVKKLFIDKILFTTYVSVHQKVLNKCFGQTIIIKRSRVNRREIQTYTQSKYQKKIENITIEGSQEQRMHDKMIVSLYSLDPIRFIQFCRKFYSVLNQMLSK